MITSRQNRVVQEVRSLGRKRENDRFLLEGPTLLAEALGAGLALDLVLYSPRATDAKALLEAASLVTDRVVEVSEELMEYAAPTVQPQGIVAVGRVPTWERVSDPQRYRRSRVVLLDGVADPGNLGTIARTARAAGVAALLLTGPCVDAWNAKVVRASAGSLFHLPVLRFARRDEAADWLHRAEQRCLLADPAAQKSCFEADLRAPVTIVLGSEARGVHGDVRRFCKEAVRIPMMDGCESLNLAAAAAILLYIAMAQEAKGKS